MKTTPEFLPRATAQELGWAQVWAQCRPVSVAGQAFRRDVLGRPYRPGDEAAWREAVEDLRAVRAAAEADGTLAERLCQALAEVPDIEAMLRLLQQGAALRQVDFFELKKMLWHGREIERALGAGGLSFSWWRTLDWERLLRLLNPEEELVPAFALSEAADGELARLRGELSRIEGRIAARKKEQHDSLRTRYGRAPGRDGLYVWERGEAAREVAAEDAELELVLKNRYETVFRVVDQADVTAMRARRKDLLTEIEEREVAVLAEMAVCLVQEVPDLHEARTALARLDWTLAKVELARAWGGSLPEWVTDQPWRVAGSWHPAAREAVEARGGVYTTLDLELQPGVGLITGPNMGGKTVALKTFGLLQALAQYAMPVPATVFHFQPVERIGMSAGDGQSLEGGLSSFGAEMSRLVALLTERGRALLLLDEVARTTNPQEGEALAVALASWLCETEHTAWIASHFPQVTRVPGVQQYRVAGLRGEMLERWEGEGGGAGDVLARLQAAFDYRVIPSDRQEVQRQAVRLARCLGLPEDLVERAERVLRERE
ncbi:hypothetical protein OS242_06660 [Tumebacillus sp. DT12]|uniref:DNA mismatch repair proteins mutS family domain-containing protein n=1 Tax=Tumebacillus lacus TaxID=2995335 RepID=A0ABT3WYA7_9BACL|nr:hypothetical protein [Tumebacillus lacus]MCX7569640.1 hypothetical protein [Tumebacillus lacus]